MGAPSTVIANQDPQRTWARRLGRRVARTLVTGFPRRFGLLEVLALGSQEWMRRHLAIINALESVRVEQGRSELRILDFGGADGSLARAMDFYGLADRYRLVLVDIDHAAIGAAVIRPPTEAAVAIDAGGDLPFAADSFDIVVSSDVFEHIPAAERDRWATELARVARLGQIHSMPADSADGTWRSTETDRVFQQWHLDRFGIPERWTAEHLATGLPTIEALRRTFPGARIEGISNARLWLAAMHAQFGPKHVAARAWFATKFYVRYRRLDGRPPFKNCLIVTTGEGGPGEV
jgi:SAM-dependent methyltransferase